jgi:26S proteasome regulatory subunit N7
LSRLLQHRDTVSAGPLLLDCIATFSCTEMCSYKDFCVYAILTNILHLPRPLLQEKIINGPEIRGVANEIPDVVSLP